MHITSDDSDVPKEIVVVIGNPMDGFRLFGPAVPNSPELEAFIDSLGSGEYWWYAPIEPIASTENRCVFYSADITSLDRSDADVATGWVDPDWSLWQVHQGRDEVRPDTWPDDRDPAGWLAETLEVRLGPLEDHGNGTFTACDAHTDHVTRMSCRMAAHAMGFTQEELGKASAILREI